MCNQYGAEFCGSAHICVAVRRERTAQLSGGGGEERYAERGVVVAVP